MYTTSIQRRSATSLMLRGSGGEDDDDDGRPVMPLLHRHDDNHFSSNHENGRRCLSWAHFAVRRTFYSVTRMTATGLCKLLFVVILSSSVASLMTYVIRGTANLWLVLCIDAIVIGLFLRDGHTLSIRSSLVLFALFLFLAAPILSESSILLLAALIVVPLQWLIHRHRQDVTLEKFKIPPVARVKAMDVHPTESYLLGLAYYTGHAVLWDIANNTSHGIELSHEQSLRSLRFLRYPKVLRDRRCFVAAGDDGRLTVVDGGSSSKSSDNAMSILTSAIAHSDFVRSVAVHPTQSIVLSCSDDRTIKVWTLVDSDSVENATDGMSQPTELWRFVLCQVLEGHHDFVMQVRFHPTMESSFVSASLDHTMIRWDWNVASDRGEEVIEQREALWFPVGTFRGHEQGINCIEFVENPNDNVSSMLLVSGSDDGTIKIWNYVNQDLIHSIQSAHDHNITCLVTFCFGAKPLMVSTCEDGLCKVWDAQGWKLDTVLNLDEGRAWFGVTMSTSNKLKLVIGYDKGCIVLNNIVYDAMSHTGTLEAPPGEDPESATQVFKPSALILSRVDVWSNLPTHDNDPTAEVVRPPSDDSQLRMDGNTTIPLAIHRTRRDVESSSGTGTVWYVSSQGTDLSSDS